MADLSIFGRLKTKQDFDREAEQWAMARQDQALKTQLMQKELMKQDQLDIKSIAEKSMFDFYQGRDLTPQGAAAIQTLAVMEGDKTTYKPDGYGNVRAVTNPNPYQQFLGGIGGGELKPGRVTRNQVPIQFGDSSMPLPAQTQLPGAGSYAPVDGLSLDDIERSLPGYSGPMTPPSAPNMPARKTDLQRIFDDPQIMNSPMGKKSMLDAALDLQKQMNSIGPGAAAKGAETYASKMSEYEAEKPKKFDAVNRILDNMKAIEPIIPALPSGMVGNFANWLASDFAGFPTMGAIAQGKIDAPLTAILMDLKQLMREPGEGTFTEGDQKLLNGMVFDKNNPLAVKLEQFNALKGVMNRYLQSLSNPVTSQDQATKAVDWREYFK